MIAYIVFGCASFIFVIATTLVLHPQYEDGLAGKLGLSMLALASAARVFNFIDLWATTPDVLLNYPKVGLLFWLGLTFFLGHHFRNLCRFQAYRKTKEASGLEAKVA